MIFRSRKRVHTWLFLFLLVAVTACGRRVKESDRGNPNSPVGNSGLGTNATLRHVSPGQLFADIQQLKRKGVVVNFWATWCGPCREELPMLAKISKAYKDRGITVLPVSVDEPDGQTKAASLLNEMGFEPPYYVVEPPVSAMKAAMYEGWQGNIPVSFLLGGDAQRRYFFNAQVYEEELTPKLDAFLAGTLPEGQSAFRTAPGLTL
jgi:thiol-disulfide isomerase/thioredoxin